MKGSNASNVSKEDTHNQTRSIENEDIGDASYLKYEAFVKETI